MDPLTTAALISGGAAVLGSGANAAMVGKTNKKSRQHNLQMFNLQNQKQLEFWNMQNAYNHPLEQRKRLEAAGLNSALMYKGGLENSAGSLTSTAPQKWDPTPPQIDVSGLQTMGNQILAAQRFKLDKERVNSEINLNDANALRALADAGLKDTDLFYRDQKNALELQIMARREQNILSNTHLNWIKNLSEQAQTRYIEARTNLAVTDNEIKKYMKEVNYNKAIADIAYKVAATNNFGATQANINSMINSRNWDSYLKEYELSMNRSGISKSDPVYWRLLFAGMTDFQNRYFDDKAHNFKPMPTFPSEVPSKK